MGIADILRAAAPESQGRPRRNRIDGKSGMSWEGQLMPTSNFDTVVAPPTITGSGAPEFGVVPTEREFVAAMGREPDAYEKPQMEGLRPFNDTSGVTLVEHDPVTKEERTVKTAMHLYITPERRRDVLLRLDPEDRGGYLACWTLLDVQQQLDIETFRKILTTDETLKEIIELDISDARLHDVGTYGMMQDGAVKVGKSQTGKLEAPVDYQAFFGGSRRQAAEEVSGAEAVSCGGESAAVVENEQKEDELKNPVQDTPVKYKISGSTMNRKCAYVKVNAAARSILVAYVIGSDSDEFDEGTEVSVAANGVQHKCEAGPTFEIPEAGVSCQIFSIKE